MIQRVLLGFTWLLMLVLCGCHSDQRKQAALCEREAMRTYASQELGTDGQVAAYIRKCRQIQGYVEDIDAANCHDLDSSLAVKPYCYKPDSWIGVA